MINAGNTQMDMALKTQPLAINRILAEARDLFGFKTDYEDVQLQRLPEVLKDARRFVDVGANRGLYSYVANAILTDSEIVAVEADPNLSHRLQEAMKTWPNPNRNHLRPGVCGGRCRSDAAVYRRPGGYAGLVHPERLRRRRLRNRQRSGPPA